MATELYLLYLLLIGLGLAASARPGARSRTNGKAATRHDDRWV